MSVSVEQLSEEIRRKKSFLCVGLDTDPAKIPAHLKNFPDPVFEFNKRIIEATQEFAVAYKPNLAFYEALGPSGWESLKKSMEVVPDGILKLADAKRGDIGNTATKYAEAFFNQWGFDAITVAPYMGSDSVLPFLQYKDKWVFLLALTSNEGAHDFQFHGNNQPLYLEVIRKSQQWATSAPGNLGYVVGATRPDQIAGIRAEAKKAFFLVPGVGAQGGSLEEVCKNGMNENAGLLINASRSIQYASSGEDFADAAHAEAKKMAAQMAAFL